MDATTCEYIDRLINIEMRPGSGLPRGVTHQMYAAAREAQNDQPLTFLAAEALIKALSKGDHVLVVTGAGTAPWLPKGETDGPMGAAAVARALDIGIGAKPVMISETRNMGPVIGSVEGIGLAIADEADFPKRGGVTVAREMPLGLEAGATFVDAIFAEFSPRAIVFVEKGGPGISGNFHSLLGTARDPDDMACAHLLVEEAKKRGVLTIGVGDGGNEIGYGKIRDAITKIQPHGPKVGTVTETDILISTAVSNWGGYGIAAALAGLLGNPDVIHSVDDEYRMLDRCIAAGAMDGLLMRVVPYVDGTSTPVQGAMITMLREIVTNSLRTINRDF
ncbi:glutamate cyclase domain-containing protein [Mesorhizobium sp. CAU 1741]|uniref:glutamate cyclase domain-containing protein n=1 Tax=Mesorhizobium sp. CAU 1741 TaxID=3140366 RepID=UPI00325AFCF8